MPSVASPSPSLLILERPHTDGTVVRDTRQEASVVAEAHAKDNTLMPNELVRHDAVALCIAMIDTPDMDLVKDGTGGKCEVGSIGAVKTSRVQDAAHVALNTVDRVECVVRDLEDFDAVVGIGDGNLAQRIYEKKGLFFVTYKMPLT